MTSETPGGAGAAGGATPESGTSEAGTPEAGTPEAGTSEGSRRWWLWGGIAFVVATLIGVGIFLALRPADDTPVAMPSESEAPEPTGVEVVIADIAIESADNAGLTASETAAPNGDAVEEAVEASRVTLETYLNAMFAEEETRFTAGALDGLLDAEASEALRPSDAEALGVIDADITRVGAARVEASATAVADTERVDLVVLTYDAAMEASTDSGPLPLTQAAQMTFVSDGSAWKVRAVDATLDVAEPSRDGDVVPTETETTR